MVEVAGVKVPDQLRWPVWKFESNSARVLRPRRGGAVLQLTFLLQQRLGGGIYGGEGGIGSEWRRRAVQLTGALEHRRRQFGDHGLSLCWTTQYAESALEMCVCV